MNLDWLSHEWYAEICPLGAQYWHLQSRQSEGAQDQKEEVDNRTEEVRGASCWEVKPRSSLSSLYLGAVEADVTQLWVLSS